MRKIIVLLLAPVLLAILSFFLYSTSTMQQQTQYRAPSFTPVRADTPTDSESTNTSSDTDTAFSTLRDLYTDLVARFDSFTSSVTYINTSSSSSSSDSPTPTPITDITSFPHRSHSSLTNLTNSDDHTQYLYGSGRVGGQTLVGGIYANDILTLQSSTATTGTTSTEKALKIIVGSGGETEALTILNNGNIGFQKTNPGFTLDVGGIINATAIYTNGTPMVSSQWTTTGTNIFYTTGNVGIGTSTPTTSLDIAGSLKASGLTFPTGAVAGYILTTDANGVASWTDVSSSAGPWSLTGNNLYPDSTSNNLAIGATDSGSAKLYVNGNVGIGTTSPSTLLHIIGSSNNQISENITNTDSAGITKLSLSNSDGNSIQYSVYGSTYTAGTYNQPNRGIIRTESGLNNGLALVAASGGIHLYSGSSEKMTMLSTGNVGIGTTTPGASLNVVANAIGTVPGLIQGYSSGQTADLLQIAKNPGATPSFVFTSAGNLGIGTSSPTFPLEVVGSVKFGTGTSSDLYMNGGTWGGTKAPTNLYLGLYSDTGALWKITSDITSADLDFQRSWGSYLSALFLQRSTGYVGVGTTSPAGNLEVHRAIDNSGVILRLSSGTTNGFDIARSHITGALSIQGDQAGYNNILLAPTSGNVGIGTTGPGARLEVSTSDYLITPLAKVKSTNVGGFAILGIDRATTDRGAMTLYSTADSPEWYTGTAYNGGVVNGKFSVGTGFNLSDAKLVIDATTGNVGIGTTGPASKLEVVDSNYPVIKGVRTSTANNTFLGAINVEHRTTADMIDGLGVGLFFNAMDSSNNTFALGAVGGFRDGADTEGGLKFLAGTNGLEEFMTIKSSGNVGIGTTSPANKLHVFTTNDGTAISVLSRLTAQNANLGVAALGFDVSSAAETQVMKGGVGFQRTNSQGSGDLLFFNRNNVDTNSFTLSDVAMIIKQSGNVGIGTTSPTTKLYVSGAITASIGNANALEVYNNSAGAGAIFVRNSGGGWGFYDDTSPKHYFNGAVGIGYNDPGTAKLAINGNVGIGTTVPQNKLEVIGGRTLIGDGTDSGWLFSGSSGGLTAFHIGSKTNVPLAFFTNSSSPRLTIDTAGNVGIGTTSPLAKLHVNGHCVTGDTMLPIRRRRKRKNGDGEDDDEDPASADGYGETQWDYFLCRIDEILPGDEVMSLNEGYWDIGTGNELSQDQVNLGSGALEYAHIHKMMDMGVHEVYELTTKSGRKIRTTANHPYLVQLEKQTS